MLLHHQSLDYLKPYLHPPSHDSSTAQCQSEGFRTYTLQIHTVNWWNTKFRFILSCTTCWLPVNPLTHTVLCRTITIQAITEDLSECNVERTSDELSWKTHGHSWWKLEVNGVEEGGIDLKFDSNNMIDGLERSWQNLIGLNERVNTLSQLMELEAGKGRETTAKLHYKMQVF